MGVMEITMTSAHQLARVLVLLASVGLAGSAMGQNALGDGRALEKRDARKYPRQDATPKGGRDFAAEVQFRNSIVTGNAPGGISFRGNVGYTAPSAFRAIAGSDDLYSFRRDSFFSGLSGQGIRGTEALQYQFAMTTGSAAPRGISGTLGVSRLTDSPTGLVRDTKPQFEDVSGSDWVRSPSSYSTSRSLKPVAIGERPNPQDERSYYRLMSSPLLGLKVQKVDLPKRGAATVKPVDTTPTGRPQDAKPGDTKPGDIKPGETSPGDVKAPSEDRPQFRTSYDDISERLSGWRKPNDATPAEPTDAKVKPWERRVDALRRHLMGLQERDVDDNDSSPLSTDDAVSKLNPDTMRMLRESGGKAKQFIELPSERATLPLYARAIGAGQQFMSQERYFDAEDRFSRALAAKFRDPTAQAGRINAQLGAGMFLSASMNLREMIIGNPEVAGVRYDPSLLPPAERLKEVIEVFRTRLRDAENANPLARSLGERESGFLLAYIGFQIGDEAVVKDGLAAVARMPADSEDDKLAGRMEHYLRAVWLGEIPTEMPEAPEPRKPESKAPQTEKPADKPAATPSSAGSPSK